MQPSCRTAALTLENQSRQPADFGRYLANIAQRESPMPITLNDLTINADSVDLDTLLSDWEWAMPEPLRPVLLTAMGDVFAQGNSGSVYFVDVVDGSIRLVADDGESFEQLLRNNQFVTDHMFPARVVEFRKAGLTLEPTQVYSHKQLLVLGGADDLENVETTDVSVHVSIHGQIHFQVKDLPNGTPISAFKIK